MNERGRVRLALTGEETGTLLGALAWVMGALQIMRDRGHAEQDSEYASLHDRVMPRLEHMLQRIVGARQAGGGSPALEAELEAAYAEVRAAFETWIHLTAVDTLSVAVAQRLSGDAAGEADAGAGATDAPAP